MTQRLCTEISVLQHSDIVKRFQKCHDRLLNFLSCLLSHLAASYVLHCLQTTQGGVVSLYNEQQCISAALPQC
jgi:hypothetical protein